MALYLPPTNPQNERFNVKDFETNLLDYSIYDARYFKLFGINNVLSINNFYGINTFFNNINSFVYLAITSTLSVANSILSPLFVTETIQATELKVKYINGIPYWSQGVFLNINNIQFPLIKSINDTSVLETTNMANSSVILYPNYKITLYGKQNILLYTIENTTDNISFSVIELKYDLPVLAIGIYYKRKKII